ncbi:MAG: phosphoribosylamine--glycine ligase [Acidimicrobiia bacterium]
MKVLLIGSGGREHALGWKLARSPRLRSLLSLPGNPGLAELGPCLEGTNPLDGPGVVEAARRQRVDLVVIGPEAPLAAGVTDHLVAADIPVWGPTQAAAQLESSKAFAKRVMARAGVPTASWGEFTDLHSALEYLETQAPPYVVKADGLAAGKGVLVADDQKEAAAWVGRCLRGDFGKEAVVIEEFLSGPEVSVFAVCAGRAAVALDPARDYKRLRDGDRGPNTGGMGSFSPVGDLPDQLLSFATRDVFRPVLEVMEEKGHPYSGFLYAGLVLTEKGPTVLEFNCRLGDPETQVVLPRLENDLLDLIEDGLDEQLATTDLRWSAEAFVNVVVASPGYPDAPRNGIPIRTGTFPADTLLFHAGTTYSGDHLVSGGGRVLNVVGKGSTVSSARAAAYEALDQIEFPGAQFRTDIAASIG